MNAKIGGENTGYGQVIDRHRLGQINEKGSQTSGRNTEHFNFYGVDMTNHLICNLVSELHGT